MSSSLRKDAGRCIGSSFICCTDASISSLEWKAFREVVIESASINNARSDGWNSLPVAKKSHEKAKILKE